jgi:surface antigen
MLPNNSRNVVLPFLLSALVCSAAGAQSGVGSLRDAPAAHFTPEDFALINAAEADLLKKGRPGTVKTWANAATGNGGTIKLLKVFKSTAGRDCRRLSYKNHAKTLRGVSTTNLCFFPDGRWLIDADATPQS